MTANTIMAAYVAPFGQLARLHYRKADNGVVSGDNAAKPWSTV